MNYTTTITIVITPQRYAIVVLLMAVCLSVCLSVGHKPVLYQND